MLATLSKIQISFSEGSLVMSEPTKVLSSSVLVTGAILISQGDCFIQNELAMNVSILESREVTGSGEVFGYPNLRDEILENPETTMSLLMQILFGETEIVDTNTTDSIIASALAGTAAAILVTTTLLCLCCCCYYRSNKKRMKKQRKQFFRARVPPSATSSLTSNALYVPQRDVTLNSHKYTIISPQPLGVSERKCTGSLRPDTTCSHTSKMDRGEESCAVVSSSAHDLCNFNRKRLKSTFNDAEWQYPRRRLVYMRELGEGQFGKVLLMKAQRGIAGYQGEIAVAVKTLTSRDPEMVAKFMEEAELMKKFTHPNIVSLLGISTNDVMDDDNAPLMILEYMAHGDLHAFLERNKPGSQTQHMQLVESHFIQFATDVAKALAFLTQLNYVQRDIAARNCLVGSELQIKIADFGLARKLNAKNYFEIEGNGVLPIRTMAPECFLTGHFTPASDVWSYGVLLWEMVSYGALPLYGLSSHEIAEHAQSGKLQHVISTVCPPVLCSLISQCHNHTPAQRPSFTDILRTLSAVFN